MNLSDAKDIFSEFFQSIKQTVSGARRYIGHLTRAHYHALGQYTFPIEGRYTQSQPPNISSLHIAGQIILFPLVLSAWLAALTIVPLIGNHLLSIGRFFKMMTNLSLIDTDKKLSIANDQRSIVEKMYGLPGMLLGALLGLIGAGTVAVARLLIEGAQTGARSFTTIANLIIHEEDKLPFKGLEEQDSRSPAAKYILGAPGLILGSLLGFAAVMATAVGRMLNNSIKSARSILFSMSQIALDEASSQKVKHLSLKGDKRSGIWKYAFGAPGLFVGSVLGSASIGVIGIFRTIGNSALTFLGTVNKMVNGVLAPDDQWGAIQDGRPKRLAYGLGLPGLLLGMAVGSVASSAVLLSRVFTNTFKTAKSVIVSMSRLALDEDTANTLQGEGLEGDHRHWALKYAVGSVGLVIGSVLGSVSIGLIGIFRTIGNSALTFLGTVNKMVNGVLAPEDQFPNIQDPRPKHLAYILGFPGFLLGLAMGSIGSSAVLLGRSFSHIFQSAKSVFISMARWSLDAESAQALQGKALEDDKRHWALKYVLGAPGLLIGSLSGSLAVGVIGVARVLSNSALSFLWAGNKMINRVLAQDDQFPAIQDSRSKHLIYGLGLPGLLLGIVFGSVASSAVLLGRVFTNTFKTAKSVIVSMSFLVLKDEMVRALQPESLHNDKRSWFLKYAAGSLGLLIGSVLGTIYIGLAGIARTIENSIITGIHTAKVIMAGVLPDNWFHFAKDPRSNRVAYGFGFPGLLLGGMLGLLSASLIIPARIAANSYESGMRLLVKMLNSVLHQENKIHIVKLDSEDKRPRPMKYLAGLPGLILAVAIASVLLPVLSIARFGTNIARTAVATFLSIINAVLNIAYRGYAIKPELALQKDERPKPVIYFLGAPGVILGGVAGVLTVSALTVGHILVQSLQSWKAFSGSLFNVALGWPKLAGVAEDRRGKIDKGFGALGYVAGAAITAPFAAAVFALRHVPILCVLILAVAVSPLTALIKWIRKWNHHRFDAFNDDKNPTIQAFKNLYSALNLAGKFEENDPIPDYKTGKKGAGAFLRKMFTLNFSTTTEKVLDYLWKAYQQSLNYPQPLDTSFKEDIDDNSFKKTSTQSFFKNLHFQKAIQEIHHIQEKSIFVSDSEYQEKQEEINNLLNFIKSYVEDYESNKLIQQRVPKIYSNGHLSKTFFGKSTISSSTASNELFIENNDISYN